MEVDHVLFAVSDLARAARRLELEHGLVSVAGGPHPGWGTANRIVPLGTSYLEVVAVADPVQAATSVFGRWVLAGASEELRPLGWCVRTTDIEAVAARVGLTVTEGSRLSPAGWLRWRAAGLEEAVTEPAFPFFIEWSPGTIHPGQGPVEHPAGPVAITKLTLRGDDRRLGEWLGAGDLPVRIDPGGAELGAVLISSATHEIVLGATA